MSTKLTAKRIPYSSVVGGGLLLVDPKGSSRFIINFMGTDKGISRTETEALCSQLLHFINQRGLQVADRG